MILLNQFKRCMPYALCIMLSGCQKEERRQSGIELDQPAGPDQPARKAKSTIYLVYFSSSHRFRLDAQMAIKFADRMVVFYETESAEIIQAWSRVIALNPIAPTDKSGDIRVVMVLGSDVYAFTRGGDYGTVNGKPVMYGSSVIAWFSKYMDSLIK